MVMTNNRPYIARALYDWIVDNACTPYILVDSHWPSIVLPPQFLDEEKIVLNISPAATRELNITNDEMTFFTRFDGETFTIRIPTNALLAIYAKENGQGMVFDPEPYPEESSTQEKAEDHSIKDAVSLVPIPNSETSTPSTKKNDGSKRKPSLKVVK